ncbi:uncharacterized protein LOC134845131 isoform X3 [Symsagittifera roscoffensis]|uniref:uncharacterized protein LOC134845131 isoform X3 n=1 Tax=Symsagittifera roscoffensis TaxID=84072 RepID=UPI00307C9258
MSSGNLLQAAASNSYHVPSPKSLSHASRGHSHSGSHLDKPSPPLTTFVGYSPIKMHPQNNHYHHQGPNSIYNSRLHAHSQSQSPQMAPRSHHHVRMSIDVGHSSPSHSVCDGRQRPVSPLVTGGGGGNNGQNDYAVPSLFQSNSGHTRDTLNNAAMSSVNKTQPANGSVAVSSTSQGQGNSNSSQSQSNHTHSLSLGTDPLGNNNSAHSQNHLRAVTGGVGSLGTGPISSSSSGNSHHHRPSVHHSGSGATGRSSSFKKDDKISSKLKKAIQEKVSGKSATGDYMQDVDSDWCRFSDAMLSRSAEAIRRLGPKIERDIDVAERLTAVIWENLRNPVSNPLVRQDNDDVCHPCKRQYLSMHTGRRCIHRIVKVYKLLAKCGISNQLLLYTAVEKQAYDVVKFLLQEASANVNGEYPPGSRMTPILYALDPSGIFGYIHAGQYKRRNLTYSKEDFMRVCIEEMSSEHDPHAELFEILVATGSNLNVRDPDGNCPVHRLGICKYESSKHVDTKILKIMLSCKHFDINARGAFGYTALHIYAMKNCEEEARLLVDRGADLDAQNDDGDTPLHIALKLAHIKIAMILIKSGCDVNRQGAHGNTPLHYCVQRPDWHYVITELINNGAIINITNDKEEAPLHLAVKHPHVCMHLIDNGALVNKQRTDGSTVLHMFARAGNYECVKMMLDADADANLPTVDGEIPLHLAVDHPRILKLLLNYGCDVDKQGLGGNSTLHYCAVTGNLSGIQALIQCSSNVNLVNDTGDSALHVATKFPDIVRCLLEAQANVNLLNCIDRLPLHCAALELEHCENWSALVESVELLLDEGSDVSTVDRSECTPLHYITAFHHLGRSRCSDSTIHTRDFNYDLLRLVQKILETDNGLVNRKDSKGCTPLHIAIENGDLELTEVLLNHHGDPYIQNKYGQTCFDIAKTSHVKDVAPEIAVLLSSKEAMMKHGGMNSYGMHGMGMGDGCYGGGGGGGGISSVVVNGDQVLGVLECLLESIDDEQEREELGEAVGVVKGVLDKYGLPPNCVLGVGVGGVGIGGVGGAAGAGGGLSKEHRETVKQVRGTLLEEMSPLYIIDAFLNQSVLSSGAAADMKSAGSRRLQSERLLSFLVCSPDQMFDLFYNTLRHTNQSHLADVLAQHAHCMCHNFSHSNNSSSSSHYASHHHAQTGSHRNTNNNNNMALPSGAGMHAATQSQHTHAANYNMPPSHSPSTELLSSSENIPPPPHPNVVGPGGGGISTQMNGVCSSQMAAQQHTYSTSYARSRAPIPPPPPPPIGGGTSTRLGSSSPTNMSGGVLSIHNPANSLLMRPPSASPPPTMGES